MTPEMTLNHRLNQTGRRIRVVLICRWALRALLAAVVSCVLWVGAARLRWVDDPDPRAYAAVLMLATVAGVAIGSIRRLTPMDVARATDRRAGARDRLATALELQTADAAPGFREPQMADASRLAGTMDIRRLYPMHVTRESVLLGILVVALVALLLAPSLPLFWSAARKKEAEQVQRNALRIERIAKDAEMKASDKGLPESAKAAQAARKLAQEMRKGRLSKKDALVKMNKATKAMEEQHRKLAMANAPHNEKPLEQASAEAKRSMDAEQAARQAEMAKQAAKQTDTKSAKAQRDAQNKQSAAMKNSQDALRKFTDALAKNDAQAQNDALQQLADQLQQGGLSAQEMKELGQQLQKLADALKGTKLDKVAKQFEEIAKKLKQMHLSAADIKRIIEAMRQAGGT